MDARAFSSLIEALEESGMSRAAIAKSARVSRETIWRVAVGEVRNVSLQTAISLDRINVKRFGQSILVDEVLRAGR